MYDETSIKILKPSEIEDRFPWTIIDSLAHEYSIPREPIERGYIACQQVGLSFQFYIDKYIKKLDIPINEELIEAYRVGGATGEPK